MLRRGNIHYETSVRKRAKVSKFDFDESWITACSIVASSIWPLTKICNQLVKPTSRPFRLSELGKVEPIWETTHQNGFSSQKIIIHHEIRTKILQEIRALTNCALSQGLSTAYKLLPHFKDIQYYQEEYNYLSADLLLQLHYKSFKSSQRHGIHEWPMYYSACAINCLHQTF